MLKIFQKRDVMVRIFLGFVLGVIGLMMVVTLAPTSQVGTTADSPTALAEIGGQQVSTLDVQRVLQRFERQQPIPPALRPFYTRQVVDQLIYTRLLEYEAKRIGLRVTDEERAKRIKDMLPTAFDGGRFISLERYTQEVQLRTGLTVPEFEEEVHKILLQEKFTRLISDGLTATPDEIELEFRRRNEKVKLEYAVLKPEEMQAQVTASDGDLSVYFEKNKARYQVAERRSARYILLDLNAMGAAPTDAELRPFYDEHIERFRVQDRSRVSHILLKTVGKTDAELVEIQKKAADILKQARRPGAKFDELARKYSEDDTTKPKSGDLNWIVRGQTVPEFETAAFTLPPGTVSDLVKTQYGFHILKVAERETAHTRTFEEVRNEIFPVVAAEKSQRIAEQQADKLAAGVRQSSRRPLDEIAREFKLPVREIPPVAQGEVAGELGPAPEMVESLFRIQKDQLGGPLRIERGYVVFVLKDIQPAHQGTLAEVRGRVLDDYRREKAAELAKSRAEELARRAQSGTLAQAAKSLGAEVKTTEAIARGGTVADVGPVRQLADAFAKPAGFTSNAANVDTRWVVYRIAERQEANPAVLAIQRAEIEAAVLQFKRQIAFDTFRTELQKRLRAEGKLQINDENLKRLTQAS